MATVPSRTTGPLVVEGWGDDGTPDSKSERYIARRLAEAGSDVKNAAFTTFMLASAVAAAIWIGCGVVLEHWVVPGGLPRWARWTWLGAGVTALVAAAIRWLMPLLLRRVNLVYAARVIEEEHPELHNDLVNTVLVKAHPEGNAAAVVRSLERRAARRLSKTPSEGIVDRSTAVWLAYAFALLVAAAVLYGLCAPKSLLPTAARLLLPWARIAAPTRVTLADPALRWRSPGEAADAAVERDDDGRRIDVVAGVATLVSGRQLVVDVGITGLRRDERPAVLVVPVPDGDQGAGQGAGLGAGRHKPAPWRAELVRAAGGPGGSRFRAVLPDPSRGLDQSVDLTIVAGDARAEPLRVAVVDAPALLVREVRYEFPEYMRREPETVAWQGDLRAVEGTRVVLVAESNQPLESAWIDFDCDGRRDLKMKVGASDLARAAGSFTLAMNADRTAPEHGSYRLLFQSRGAEAGGRDRLESDRLEHRIEVLPDLAPEVSIEDPQESPLRVPPTAPVPVTVRALDPDFGLARVAIEVRLRGAADRGGAVQPEIPLARSNRRGAFVGTADVMPERYGAVPGTVLEYRAIAVDTRPNEPNITTTPWQALSIDPSAAPRPRPPEKEQPKDRDRGDAGRDDGDAGEAAAGDDPGAGDRSGSMKDGGRDAAPDGGKNAGRADGNGDEKADGGEATDRRRSGGDRAADAEDQKPDDPRADRQGHAEKQGERQGDKQGDKQGEGQGQGDARGMKQQDRGADGGKQSQSGGRRDEKDDDREDAGRNASQGGQQGKPKPGQQDGAAEGAKQGGKTPQTGANQQRGGTQGEPRDSGDAAGDDRSGGANGQRGQPRQGGAGMSPAGAKDGAKDGAKADGGQRPAGKDGSQEQKGPSGGEKAGSRPQADRQDGGRESAARPRPSVAADGTNDGEAMERILENRRRQQAEAGDENGEAGDKKREAGGDNREGGGKNAAGAAGRAGSEKDDQRSGQRSDERSQQRDDRGGGKRDQAEQGGGAGQQPVEEKAAGKDAGQKPDAGKAPKPGQAAEEKQCVDGTCGGGQCAVCQGKSGVGGQGAGKEGAGKEGAGKEGAGKEGAGKEGAGKEGAGKEGAGKEGAARSGGEQPVEPGGQQGGRPQPQADGQSSPVGGGGVSGGEAADRGGVDAAAQPSREMEWGRQELENARNAADLAIAHLRDAVAQGKNDVLDDLGWTPEQARAFLERWEAMRRLADSPDPRQRGEFERMMRSLGLRPAGASSSRDVPSDVKGGQAEGRRSRPPSDYRERFKAFLQGAGGE